MRCEYLSENLYYGKNSQTREDFSPIVDNTDIQKNFHLFLFNVTCPVLGEIDGPYLWQNKLIGRKLLHNLLILGYFKASKERHKRHPNSYC